MRKLPHETGKFPAITDAVKRGRLQWDNSLSEYVFSGTGNPIRPNIPTWAGLNSWIMDNPNMQDD